ncbi:protein YLS7-like [Phalaenopsis equestris]|uniref:protein YLS7-like n=1 Tax=Phalaenopsis equestris TaxID=78828 RepID=UPI0009E389B5|nr:protein YLS7-like [Phalaenopsis equestris]
MEIVLSKKFLWTCTVHRSLVIAAGIMALFLMTASWFLVSSTRLIYPFSAKVAEDIQTLENATKSDSRDHGDGRLVLDGGGISLAQSNKTKKAEFGFDKFPLVAKPAEDSKPFNNSTKTVTGRLDSNTSTWAPARHISHSSNSVKAKFGDCDLYHGKWIYDPAGPLYTNSTCPILTQSQNCQGNGRPDKDYENWRWKPDQCEIPRFDATKFLGLMKGKVLAFIGDSVARNQMESLLCILWQLETPRMRGNRRMHRWVFKTTSTTIVRIWSSWLVGKSMDALQSAPRGIPKVCLDEPDEAFFELLPMFDVVVLSSGHWFSKRSIYILNGEIVGSQLWRSESALRNHINSMTAYNIAMETILTAMATHPNYTGLTILRTYSPDHYKGGSCSNNVKPARKVDRNGHTLMMHDKQVEGFREAAKKVRNKSKLRLMDITEAFGYRHDGHPGRYRSPDAKNSRGRYLSEKTQSEDCLHWCMPGPADIWNEILFEILKREL